MKEKEPSSLIGALENGWFNRHGIPNILLSVSDQEGAVDGQRIREMCKRLGIQKRRSSVYHQQGDGQAERSIQSFKTALRCIFEDRQIADTHWPKLLQEITFILNSLPNASTGFSPHEVMYGTQLRLPLVKWLPFQQCGEYVEVEDYVDRACQRNEKLWKEVQRKTEKSKTTWRSGMIEKLPGVR